MTDAAMPLAIGRRRLGLAAAGLLAAPAFIRHALAADVPRFTLGVASGQPRPHSVVLWTRLMGLDLPERCEVRWELAEDEGFSRLASAGVFEAEAAWAPPASPSCAPRPPRRAPATPGPSNWRSWMDSSTC